MEALDVLPCGVIALTGVYAVYLLITGKPIFTMRARPTSTKPILMENDWFRAAGGIYLLDVIIFLVFPSLSIVIFRIVEIASAVCWIVGLIKTLSKPVM
ncbi:hypothetical protein CEE37_10495 [candidate division LCP-89 bacterium B3_LCP]|uniref:Uncharacterized protein n=1 Tax=candidate division LCP-89 bacterium B3_LCP TaxID=2012998 RepID=A0A532UXS0_UNCL8|nr:MAG: hypothetical protein CEE37_10495 [candidate division LCP-89 bacterium B3_LCP]